MVERWKCGDFYHLKVLKFSPIFFPYPLYPFGKKPLKTAFLPKFDTNPIQRLPLQKIPQKDQKIVKYLKRIPSLQKPHTLQAKISRFSYWI
jgi:hypothetical protein